MAMRPWDGDRALTPRIVLECKEVTARGLSFAFVTEQVSEPTDWCSHDAAHHLMYVYRGGAMHSMQTALDWGKPGQVPNVGDIWWKPAGIACAALVQGETAGYCEITIPLGLLGDAALLPRVKYQDPLFHQLVEELYSVADRDDSMAQLLVDSAAKTVGLLIRDQCAATAPTQHEHRPLDAGTRKFVVEYLNDSVDSDIRLDALAQLAGMSVQGFIGAFRRDFHITPYQYLLDLRMDRAKMLLLDTSQSVAEIAEAVGFSTPGHFATVFKQRVGISPSAYRRRS